MESQGNYLLAGQVEVKEFFVDGPEKGKPGRGSDKKGLVLMSTQVDAHGIHRCNAKVIENAGAGELGAFLDEMVDKKAAVWTDSWKGYVPSAAGYPKLKQEPGKKGKDFTSMHKQIIMFKAWLRGIHHYCGRLKSYLNEFCYRFNRLKYPQTVFHNFLTTMIGTPPVNFLKK